MNGEIESLSFLIVCGSIPIEESRERGFDPKMTVHWGPLLQARLLCVDFLNFYLLYLIQFHLIYIFFL